MQVLPKIYHCITRKLARLRIYHSKLHSEVTASLKSDKQGGKETKNVAQHASNQHFQAVVESNQSYIRKGIKWKELTDAVTYFLAEDTLPKKSCYFIKDLGIIINKKKFLDIYDHKFCFH